MREQRGYQPPEEKCKEHHYGCDEEFGHSKDIVTRKTSRANPSLSDYWGFECKGRFQELMSGSQHSALNLRSTLRHPLLHIHRQIPGWANTNQMRRRERGPGRSALSSAVKLAVARVGKRPKDDASVFIDGMPKIHGEGENNDKEEEIDAKQRMQ